MNKNIGPNALASRLISSLIKGKMRGEQAVQPKEGLDLVGITQKLFSHKQDKDREAASNEQ